jgi:N-acetylglutamate synthase-like GNAT family acetyltransferase
MTPRRVMNSCLPNGLAELARVAAAEGFGMVDRLIIDHRDGSNTFSKHGESLWIIEQKGRIIAVGGINIDPYYDSPSLGRIRHLYVHPDFRRNAVGRRLMRSIEESGSEYFETFQLFTAEVDASRFYEALSYTPVNGQRKVSHAKRVAA